MRILYVLILITLHKFILCKKLHHLSASDESIENLLIYKDCRRKGDEKPPKEPLSGQVVPPSPPPPPPPSQCPCPRVCCSLCCDCGNFQSQTSIMSQQMQPLQSPIQPWNGPPMDTAPITPPQSQRRKKTFKFPSPIGARRDLNSAREHIKGLIAQDQDIKKILKDLVRVTMQKVDVIETIKARQAAQQVRMRKEETGNEKAVEVTNESAEEDL